VNFSSYIPYYRRILVLALPVVLSQVGQVTVGLVDTMMIGHVGTTELAASAFANNVFLFGMLFGMGITIGMTPLTGEAFGSGNKKEIAKWLKNGMVTHVVTAMIISVLLFALYFTLPYMGQTEKVVELAKPYYLILCASYMPFLLYFSVKQFLEGIGNTKYAMQITIISNLVNILANYVLIFGKWGFPELGLVGAGIGTLISRLIMPFLWLIYFNYLPEIKHYFIEARNEILEWKRIRKLLAIGVPIGFQIVIEISAFIIGAIMMGWIGETELAAHQVAIGLAGFTFMICLGISQATTIRISHQMGQQDYKSLKHVAYASTHLILLFMSFMAVAFILGRNILPILFTSDQDVIEIASQLLIIAAIFQLFDGLQVIMLSILRGMADVRTPMFIAIFTYIFIALPISYFFAFDFGYGPPGIWYGYLVGLGLAGILFYRRFLYILKKH
jgi:MATE family multidrug resistance protein